MHDLSGFTFKSNKDIWNAFENIVKNTEKGKWIMLLNVHLMITWMKKFENELERVWIQEISPSREEIRILPLKTKFENMSFAV